MIVNKYQEQKDKKMEGGKMDEDERERWEIMAKDWGWKRETGLRVILQETYGKPYLEQLTEEEFADFKKRLHKRIFGTAEERAKQRKRKLEAAKKRINEYIEEGIISREEEAAEALKCYEEKFGKKPAATKEY